MCFRRTTVVGPSDQVIDEEIRSLVLVGSARRFRHVRTDAVGPPSRICRTCSRGSRATPTTGAPASQSSDATVVEEIIVRINNSIISLSDLKRSQDQLTAEMNKQDPNTPAARSTETAGLAPRS